jgi:hypothetical protein
MPAPQLNVLENIRIASPCHAAWDELSGDDRVRFCSHCRLNVYNLSDMPRAEAEQLVREREGRLCVRFYRRRDGTVLTDNCPVGLRAARRWLLAHLGGVTAAFGMITLFAPLARAEHLQKLRNSEIARHEPFRTLFAWMTPPSPPPVTGRMVMMGAMAAPPTPVTPPPPARGK